MTDVFKDMAFQLKTERLDLNMWEESDAVWLRKLIGERGVEMPTIESVRSSLIEMRKKAIENGISLLTIRRRDEGDFIGYCGLIIGRATLEEPEIAYELFKVLIAKVMRQRQHQQCWKLRLLRGAIDFGLL